MNAVLKKYLSLLVLILATVRLTAEKPNVLFISIDDLNNFPAVLKRHPDGSEELYDRKADPNEWTNLAGKESLSSVKTRLAKYLPN